jgi:ABC-type amino acid transport substrate-binding protein
MRFARLITRAQQRRCVLAALGLLLPVLVRAQALPEIEYGVPDQSVWTTRVNAQGDPDNPLFDVATAIFSRAGIPWHGKNYPASRLFKYLQDGTPVQFSMLVKAPTLQKCCLWSRKPVATVEIRAYHFGNQSPLKSREDLSGKRVITIRGYSYAGLRDFITDPQNRIANNESPTHAAAFRMLIGGRADYLIDYAGPANEVLAAEPLADMRFDVLARQDVHLVLVKTYPDAARVMAQLDAILETLDVAQLLKAHARR